MDPDLELVHTDQFEEQILNIFGTHDEPFFRLNEILSIIPDLEKNDIVQQHDCLNVNNDIYVKEDEVYYILIQCSQNKFAKSLRTHIKQICKQLCKINLQNELTKTRDELEIQKKQVLQYKQKTYEEIEKLGSIYVIRTDGGIKVGKSKVVATRIRGLQTANVNDIEILMEFKTSNEDLLEKIVHYILDRYRCNSNREFFDCNVDYIKTIILIIGNLLDVLKSTFQHISCEELYNRIQNCGVMIDFKNDKPQDYEYVKYISKKVCDKEELDLTSCDYSSIESDESFYTVKSWDFYKETLGVLICSNTPAKFKYACFFGNKPQNVDAIVKLFEKHCVIVKHLFKDIDNEIYEEILSVGTNDLETWVAKNLVYDKKGHTSLKQILTGSGLVPESQYHSSKVTKYIEPLENIIKEKFPQISEWNCKKVRIDKDKLINGWKEVRLVNIDFEKWLDDNFKCKKDSYVGLKSIMERTYFPEKVYDNEEVKRYKIVIEKFICQKFKDRFLDCSFQNVQDENGHVCGWKDIALKEDEANST